MTELRSPELRMRRPAPASGWIRWMVLALLAPAAIFDVGTKVLVVLGDEVRYLRLTELQETTRSFSRFGVESAEKPKMKTPLTPPSTMSAPDRRMPARASALPWIRKRPRCAP